MRDDFYGYADNYFASAAACMTDAVSLKPVMEQAATAVIDSLRADGSVYFIGNGGSASDAQHLAAELMGKFAINRDPLRSVCLNTDTSVMTAISNDLGYNDVFSRQVHALARPGDVVVLISTSGESPSILAACEQARRSGAITIGLTGPNDSSLARQAQIVLAVGEHATCHLQQAHITIGQALCGFVERAMFGSVE